MRLRRRRKRQVSIGFFGSLPAAQTLGLALEDARAGDLVRVELAGSRPWPWKVRPDALLGGTDRLEMRKAAQRIGQAFVGLAPPAYVIAPLPPARDPGKPRRAG